jgi:tetratricopeptide (TPR) repeat protein
VATTVQQFGRNSLQTAEAYFDLAEAQRRARDHDAATRSYLEAVEIYRAIDGAFTPLAINPLTSLGDNYHEAGDDLNAVASYTEARTVSRRVYGLLSERQIELLDRMSRSLLELNQSVEADAQQVEALRLIERNYPPESDQALAGIYKYASWLRDRGQFQLERDQYMRALRIIREYYGKENVRQVEPLVGIGNSFRNQRIPDGQGIGALQDASSRCSPPPCGTHCRPPSCYAISATGKWPSAKSATMAPNIGAPGNCSARLPTASNCAASGLPGQPTCYASRLACAA